VAGGFEVVDYAGPIEARAAVEAVFGVGEIEAGADVGVGDFGGGRVGGEEREGEEEAEEKTHW
jgi:hypothetical protein